MRFMETIKLLRATTFPRTASTEVESARVKLTVSLLVALHRQHRRFELKIRALEEEVRTLKFGSPFKDGKHGTEDNDPGSEGKAT